MGRVGHGNRTGAFARCAAGRCSLLVVVASLLACSGEKVLGDYPPTSCDLAEEPVDVDDESVSIASFWGSDTWENEALQELVGRMQLLGFSVSKDQMTSRVDVQTRIDQAFENRRLPDVFQVNGGSDVLRWVERREPETTDVCALDRLRDESAWRDKYFSSALSPLTCHGSLYGLPIGIHHLNVLFYNHELFDKLTQLAAARGLTLVEPSELTSVQELLAQLELIADLGYETASGPLVPLAVGTADEWPLTVVAFENVLLSLSREAYETLWTGEPHNDSERLGRLEQALRRMLVVLRSFRQVSNFDARKRWQDAVRQVGDGEAFMTVTGDWGWAQLTDKRSVKTATFPGTAGTFVYTPDSFAVPRALNTNGFPARSFLRDAVADKETLIAFSNKKHSIPPRHDLDDDDIAALASESLRSTYDEFKRCGQSNETCTLLLAVSGLGPPPGTDPCFDQMDALLSLAVWDEHPLGYALETRPCEDGPFPATGAEAEERLIALLLRLATQRFATDCR